MSSLGKITIRYLWWICQRILNGFMTHFFLYYRNVAKEGEIHWILKQTELQKIIKCRRLMTAGNIPRSEAELLWEDKRIPYFCFCPRTSPLLFTRSCQQSSFNRSGFWSVYVRFNKNFTFHPWSLTRQWRMTPFTCLAIDRLIESSISSHTEAESERKSNKSREINPRRQILLLFSALGH